LIERRPRCQIVETRRADSLVVDGLIGLETVADGVAATIARHHLSPDVTNREAQKEQSDAKADEETSKP
jgi:hypothetical protein